MTTTTAPAPNANATPHAPAGQLLTPEMVTFSKHVGAGLGIDPNVIAAWILQEGGSVTGGKYNYLNIGNTDSGSRNQSAVWNGNVVTAAAATVAWIKGQSKAGYTTASPGIQNLAHIQGETAEQQVVSIQHSGFATSGEPLLGSLYDKVLQTGGVQDPNTNASESVPTAFSDPSSNLPSNPLSGLTGAVETLVGDLTSKQFWLRAAEVVGGLILLVVGLKTLTGVSMPTPAKALT